MSLPFRCFRNVARSLPVSSLRAGIFLFQLRENKAALLFIKKFSRKADPSWARLGAVARSKHVQSGFMLLPYLNGHDFQVAQQSCFAGLCTFQPSPSRTLLLRVANYNEEYFLSKIFPNSYIFGPSKALFFYSLFFLRSKKIENKKRALQD